MGKTIKEIKINKTIREVKMKIITWFNNNDFKIKKADSKYLIAKRGNPFISSPIVFEFKLFGKGKQCLIRGEFYVQTPLSFIKYKLKETKKLKAIDLRKQGYILMNDLIEYLSMKNS